MTMTIPFLSLFKKVKDQALARKEQSVAAPKLVTPLDKPSNERFSKTVMPNTTRTLPPQDPFEMAARSSAAGGQMPSASAGGVRVFSFTHDCIRRRRCGGLPPKRFAAGGRARA